MGDDDHRLAVLVGEDAHPFHHLAVRVGIEAAGQFVQEKELRVADQRLGKGHPPHLAAG